MKPYYQIRYKMEEWKYYEPDILSEKFPTKALAQQERLRLQKLGFIQVSIKKIKGNTHANDYR